MLKTIAKPIFSLILRSHPGGWIYVVTCSEATLCLSWVVVLCLLQPTLHTTYCDRPLKLTQFLLWAYVSDIIQIRKTPSLFINWYFSTEFTSKMSLCVVTEAIALRNQQSPRLPNYIDYIRQIILEIFSYGTFDLTHNSEDLILSN